MFQFISGALFLVFIANVLAGAIGDSPFLGDVGEMVVLFIASLAFVVVILKREAADTNE